MKMQARSGLGWVALVLLSVACGGTGAERSPNVAGAGGASAGTDTGASGSESTAGIGGVSGGGGAAQGSGGVVSGGAGAGVGGSGGGGGAEGMGGAYSGGSGGSGGGSAGPFPPGVTKPRVMIVGDSISAGPGCYKKYLLQNLATNHYSQFEFVGEYTDDCGSSVRHSAVSCSTAEQYTGAMFTMPNCAPGKSWPGLSTLMTAHHPDLLMLQLGVNDVWGGKTTEQTLGNYQKLVEQARAQNPRVVLVVAQIQKIRPNCGTDDSVQKRAESLVMAVPAWAQKLNSAQSPVFVADLWTNSDWSMAETTDCVHPNEAGAQRMGLNWFNALKSILKPD